MMKKNKVEYYASSVYDISSTFFIEKKINTLVIDLDNTLDPAYASIPSVKAYELKQRLERLNIRLLVISNNHEKRVKPYCRSLGVDYLADANKFFVKKIKKFLKDKNVDISSTLFVGDQLFTDRIYVHKLHGRLILTDPLVKKDHIYTRLIRWLDNYLRKKWKKQNRLGQKIEKGGTDDVL